MFNSLIFFKVGVRIVRKLESASRNKTVVSPSSSSGSADPGKKRQWSAPLAVTAFALMCGVASPSFADQEWITLIDGEVGLDNFNKIGDANWRAEDGAIVADDGAGGHLVTPMAYGNVEIYAEFWAEDTTNSGIFVRAQNPEQIGFSNAYEINIFDQRPVQEYSTGAVVGFAPVQPPYPRAAGAWNTFSILAVGDELSVVFNGEETSRMTNDEFSDGPVSFQYARGANGIRGGVIKWRKVMIRPLP